MWKPINPKHSIETMAMVIAVTEPLSSVVYRRIIRGLEPLTFEQGLTVRTPIQGLALRIEENSITSKPSLAHGMVFQKQSLVRNHDEQVVSKTAAELVVDPNQIVFRDMLYSSWFGVSTSLWKMIEGAIPIITSASDVRMIRLEYLDRFFFDGVAAEATAHGVIKIGSDLVSPHIYALKDLWHSHTGKLASLDPVGEIDLDAVCETKRLFQVNIDMVDLTAGELAGKRSIGVLTAVEDRFLPNGMEDATLEMLRTKFDDLHIEAKKLFTNTVDDMMLAEVGL